jgi:hypothetical protein
MIGQAGFEIAPASDKMDRKKRCPYTSIYSQSHFQKAKPNSHFHKTFFVTDLVQPDGKKHGLHSQYSLLSFFLIRSPLLSTIN